MHFLTGSRMVNSFALCRLYSATSRIPLRVQLRPEFSTEHFQANQSHAQTDDCRTRRVSHDFPVFVMLFSPCAPTDKHHDTVQRDTDPERFRSGVGLLLAGNDWRSILSERAQWVRYP